MGSHWKFKTQKNMKKVCRKIDLVDWMEVCQSIWEALQWSMHKR